ncbi:hypothetical protein [Deinococcus kurensis]|uniref:hypothetical protein n=1 Tax=Deinococcus kurensis TaxID=2662757 RepID=UPI0012D2EA65|nr:hypothetical protein [Deinococcus kurensis]
MIPTRLHEHLKPRLSAHPAPYAYALRGTPAASTTAARSAHAAFRRLREWAQRQGADVQILTDEFITTSKGRTACRLIIEVTDPAAIHLDRMLGLL